MPIWKMTLPKRTNMKQDNSEKGNLKNDKPWRRQLWKTKTFRKGYNWNRIILNRTKRTDLKRKSMKRTTLKRKSMKKDSPDEEESGKITVLKRKNLTKDCSEKENPEKRTILKENLEKGQAGKGHLWKRIILERNILDNDNSEQGKYE